MAFLDFVEAVDPEMAAILKDNWAGLVEIVREGERDPKARADFNNIIAEAHDALIAKAQPGES